MENKRNWTKWLSSFVFAVAVITVYKTFDNLHNVFAAFMRFVGLLTPFIIGFILAFFLYPACQRLERVFKKSKKAWIVKQSEKIAILTVYFLFVAVLIIALVTLMPKLSASIADLLYRLPDYLNEIVAYLEGMSKQYSLLSKIDYEQFINSISIEKMLDHLYVNNIGQYVEGVKGFTSILMSWFMGVIVCAYTLLERDSLFRMARRLFGLFMKNETMDKVGYYQHEISNIFYQFFFGKMIDSIIIGLIAIVGFYFLGVPFALLMGIIIMIFNMIPYFGPIIGALPVVIITLLVRDIYSAIWTAVFIFALQQFDGIVLGPKILGKSVGISPFWVIFAIIIFGGLFGLWGMVFGVPVVAAIRMLLLDYLDDRKLNGAH